MCKQQRTTKNQNLEGFNLTQWDKTKAFFKTKYFIDLQDDDQTEYTKMAKEMNKKMIPAVIFLLFGVGVLLFIVFGMLTSQLTMDEYTFFPLFFVLCMVVSSGSGLTKTQEKYYQQFITQISEKRSAASAFQASQGQQPVSAAPRQRGTQMNTDQSNQGYRVPQAPQPINPSQQPQQPQTFQNAPAPQSFQGSVTFQGAQPFTHSSTQTFISTAPGAKKPVAATNCPVCGQLIPMGSNPCPKCGAQMLWN